MKLAWLVMVTVLAATHESPAQTLEDPSPDPDEVAVYTQAIAALVGAPQTAGVFYVAGRLRINGGRLLSSPAPEAVSRQLAESGYSVELAELAENGLWQVPRGSLFLMLRKIEFCPGRKIAMFSIDVGSGIADMREMAFKFRKEKGECWVLIEKGPAENEA